MKKNIFYIGYQTYFLELAKQMETHNWEPVYFSVVPSTSSTILSEYPKVIVHDHYDAIRGKPPGGYFPHQTIPICPLFLEKMALHERIVMRLFERNDSNVNNFTYRERIELYRDLVKFWISTLEDLNPHYVIFEEEPHQASDYVLYAICQEINIETILFVRTRFHERMYAVHNFINGSKKITSEYHSQLKLGDYRKLELSEYMKMYLSDIRGEYSNSIKVHLYDQVDEVKNLQNKKLHAKLKFFYSLFKFNKTNFLIRWRLFFSLNGVTLLSDQKVKNKLFKNSYLTYSSYIFYRVKTLIKKRQLKIFYNVLSKEKVCLKKSYVFCALHYQPEKTTCPLGGDFEDQLYMLQLISEALPSDWLIYVKDHPSQFVSSYTRYGEHFRSKSFYKKIIEIPNVRLVPLSFDTFDLIDNSKLVATVTGTSAWEAVVRGTPSLVFGSCWFKGCEGVFPVYSYDSIHEALRTIERGYTVQADRVELFASVVENCSYSGVIGGEGIRKYFNITDYENGVAHSSAIKDLLDL